jgi:hypothetical protein
MSERYLITTKNDLTITYDKYNIIVRNTLINFQNDDWTLNKIMVASVWLFAAVISIGFSPQYLFILSITISFRATVLIKLWVSKSLYVN